MHNKRLKLDVIFNGDRRRLKYLNFVTSPTLPTYGNEYIG
jgi:hypothetical protein